MEEYIKLKIKMLQASHGDCMLMELNTNNNKVFTILIDGGTEDSYKNQIRENLEEYLEGDKKIDLVIITHSDDDHISGMNYILKNKKIVSKIEKVIYNSPYAVGKYLSKWDGEDLTKSIPPKVIEKTNISSGFRKIKKNDNANEENNAEKSVNTSALKANELQQILFDLEKLNMNLVTNNGESDIEEKGISICFLSPTLELLENFYKKYKADIDEGKRNILSANTGRAKSDYNISFNELIKNTEIKKLSKYNMASLAFIVYEQCTSQSILIMGDSSYKVVTEKLLTLKDKDGLLYGQNNPLRLDYLKVSHHGSICDLTEEFLKIIDCKKFLISTDGSSFNHPDKKLIARIYNKINDATFYFNYDERMNKITKEGGIIKKICKYKKEF